MKLLLRVSLGLLLALAAAVAAALLLGRAQPTPGGITRLHLSDCTPPCWIGIVPGQTTIADAKAKMLAIYGGRSDLRIRDTSGGPNGYISANTVENVIEGASFYLSVRLTTSTPVDGRSEIVQAIALMPTRSDRSRYTPTVEDILGTFGAPQGMFVEDSFNSPRQITLTYAGLDVVFNADPEQRDFAENPHFFLQDEQIHVPTGEYRPWTGLGALLQRM